MKILITGNLGYVGPIVARHLRRAHPDADLIGYDSAFFALSTTGAQVLPERTLDAQYFGDVREIPDELLEGVDAVVHLAAVSNDPMGNKFERVTEDINYRASVDLGTQGQQGRRIAFRLRLELQRLWLCARRGPQGDRRTQSADRLCPLQGEHRKGTCRDRRQQDGHHLPAVCDGVRHVGPAAA